MSPSTFDVGEPGEVTFRSISYDDVGTDLRRIEISGRLDMPGTDSVAAKLTELAAAPKRAVVIDLSSLKFLASIGISALIACAKEVQRRGGKMALVVNSGSTVRMSLEATGVDELIPVFEDASEAEKAVLA
ncbi:MAG TPA: STAS domain-containing protein [Usitatibacter sp.]|nr:STAS domain-containing protein [Usitatibacter sp.]